jgi:hypothetical protein
MSTGKRADRPGRSLLRAAMITSIIGLVVAVGIGATILILHRPSNADWELLQRAASEDGFYSVSAPLCNLSTQPFSDAFSSYVSSFKLTDAQNAELGNRILDGAAAAKSAAQPAGQKLSEDACAKIKDGMMDVMMLISGD